MCIGKRFIVLIVGLVFWPVGLTCAKTGQNQDKTQLIKNHTPIEKPCKETRELELVKQVRLTGLGWFLKTRPTPILLNDLVIFNATKGTGAYSLPKRKLVWKRLGAKYLGRCGVDQEVLIKKKSRLICLQGDTGKPLWRAKAPFFPIKSVLADSSRVFISSTGFRVAALKAENGSLEWGNLKVDPTSKEKFDTKGGCGWQHEGCWYQEQSPLGFCGPNLVLGAKNGLLKAFSATSGKEIWTKIFRTPDTGTNVKIVAFQANGPWIDVGEIGYLGMADKVASLDCLTGEEKGVMKVDAPVNAFFRYKDKIVGYTGNRHLFAFGQHTWPNPQWNYFVNLGNCHNEDYMCYFIAGDILWRAPHNPINGDFFRGLSLIDPTVRYDQVVGKKVIPRGRPLGSIDINSPIWKKSKKTPFLYWNKQFVHLDGQTIRFYQDKTNPTQGDQGVKSATN